jgi:hypothetical protein
MTADIDTRWARAQQRDSNRRAEANIRKVIALFKKPMTFSTPCSTPPGLERSSFRFGSATARLRSRR